MVATKDPTRPKDGRSEEASAKAPSRPTYAYDGPFKLVALGREYPSTRSYAELAGRIESHHSPDTFARAWATEAVDRPLIQRAVEQSFLEELKALGAAYVEAASANAKLPEAPAGVDAGWVDLGRRLGFLPVSNNVAVVEYKNQTYPGELASVTDPAERITLLRARLVECGRSNVTVSMVVPHLSSSETNRIFAQNAYVIEVSDTFWVASPLERIKAYRKIVPASNVNARRKPRVLASERRRHDPVPGLYSGRNPDLEPEDVELWRRRVFES